MRPHAPILRAEAATLSAGEKACSMLGKRCLIAAAKCSIVILPGLLVVIDKNEVGLSLVLGTRPLPLVGSIRPLPSQLSG